MLLLAILLAAQAAGQETLEPTPLERRMTDEVRVVRTASPAVVYIEVERLVPQGWLLGRLQHGKQITSGSGAVLDADGLVITNFHVVGRDARRITVQFDPDLDTTVYEAQLVSAAPSEDLALLKIKGEREFPVLRRGTSSDLMIGERVIAIGNPLRQRLSVSSGIISGLHRNVTLEGRFTFTDLIQTDAAINPGNSGGPLLNVLGELVGINTAVNEGAQNMGFAIPVDRVEEVLSEVLMAPGAGRAWLGMDIDESNAFRVCDLVEGGPAALGGVAHGDRLVAIDQRPVTDSQTYRAQIVGLSPGTPVEFSFARDEADGTQRRYEVTLAGWRKVDGVLHKHLGLRATQAVVGTRLHVQVASVVPGGPAAELGLQSGDVLDSVRTATGKSWIVDSPGNLASIVGALGSGSEITIDLYRDADGNRGLGRDEMLRGTLRLR